MNNYLANIAARSFKLTPLVRPRLPGQFEPAPLQREGAINQPGFGRLEEMAAELPESEIDSAARVETAPQRAPVRRTRRSLDGEHEPDSAAAPGSQRASHVVRVEAGPIEMSINALTENGRPGGAAAARPDRADRQSDGTAPRAALDELRTPELHRVSAVRQRPAGNFQPALGKHDEELGNPRPPAARRFPAAAILEPEPADVRERQGIDDSARRDGNGSKLPPVTTIAPSSGVFEQNGSTNRLPVIVQSRISPLLEGDKSALQSKVSPEPTVHVTIGRIEVRAVQSSQPSPAKPRASTPVMNLDDYLRRRNQGGAR